MAFAILVSACTSLKRHHRLCDTGFLSKPAVWGQSSFLPSWSEMRSFEQPQTLTLYVSAVCWLSLESLAPSNEHLWAFSLCISCFAEPEASQRMLEYFRRIRALAGFFAPPAVAARLSGASVDVTPARLCAFVQIRVAVVGSCFSLLLIPWPKALESSLWFLGLFFTGDAIANFFRCFFNRSAAWRLGNIPREDPAPAVEVWKHNCVSEGSLLFTFLTITSDLVSVDCRNHLQILDKSKGFMNSICTGDNFCCSNDLDFRALRLLFQISLSLSALFFGFWCRLTLLVHWNPTFVHFIKLWI